MLDSSGVALLAAVDGRPTVLKPNLFELWQIDRRQADVSAERNLEEWTVDEICAAARRVLARGVRVVVVSLGKRGVLGIEEGGIAWQAAVTLDRPVVDTVGCGDALAAGLVVSLARGEGLVNALRLGVSCGAANALVRGAGRCERQDIERLLARVEVEVV
jgi:fructose-1-phosphate kinase PfkB-like protein